MELAAGILVAIAILIAGMYLVITRPIVKHFEKLSRERQRAAPKTADPDFRTLDDN